MTQEEMEFWSKAFLAAMQGIVGDRDRYGSPHGYIEDASDMAERMLAVWREKMRELQVPENGGKG